jgi:hypothetical protein
MCGNSKRAVVFGPGYRIYFGRDGEQLVILLAGGTKKRQQDDIAAAHERCDAAFRDGLFREGVELLLAGDIGTGKALLRDYINGTIGFKVLCRTAC